MFVKRYTRFHSLNTALIVVVALVYPMPGSPEEALKHQHAEGLLRAASNRYRNLHALAEEHPVDVHLHEEKIVIKHRDKGHELHIHVKEHKVLVHHPKSNKTHSLQSGKKIPGHFPKHIDHPERTKIHGATAIGNAANITVETTYSRDEARAHYLEEMTTNGWKKTNQHLKGLTSKDVYVGDEGHCFVHISDNDITGGAHVSFSFIPHS